MKEGRKRKVVIKDAKVTDAGMYACISNADKTEAELIVNCKIFTYGIIPVLKLQCGKTIRLLTKPVSAKYFV